jgi:hypothetical protein
MDLLGNYSRDGHALRRYEMSNTQETAWETALEQGLHESGALGEFEAGEGEGILGTIGNVLGALLSEGEIVSEAGEGEGILGAIGNVLGGLLGEEETAAEGTHESEFESELESELGGHGESEWEHAFSQESELESEMAHEHPEQFFGGLFKKIGGLVRKAAPVLTQVARVAAPMVAKAVGGPFGGILSSLGGSLLGESEEEMELGAHEMAHEFSHESLHEFAHETGLHELTHEAGLHEGHPESGLHEIAHEIHTELAAEAQHESAHEVAHEIASHEIAQHEALAEVMAEAAAHEHNEGHAEAMVGAAVVTTLSPADRRALRLILADLVRGSAVLTRILRQRRITRPAVRAVPTIIRRTVRTLKRQAAQGKPITRRMAGKAAAVQVRRVLGNPSACAAAISQNVRATRALKAKSARTQPVIRG